MSSAYICCSPIELEDDNDDMELEELWELQRTKSQLKAMRVNKSLTRGRQGQHQKNSSRKNMFQRNRGNKVDANSLRGGMQRPSMRGMRSASVGRQSMSRRSGAIPVGRSRSITSRSGYGGYDDRDERDESSPERGFFNNAKKQVSISRYVEKVYLPPDSRDDSSIHTTNSRPVTLRRSRSEDSYRRGPRTVIKPKRKGKKLFRWRNKKKNQQQEDIYSSSSSGSYDGYDSESGGGWW